MGGEGSVHPNTCEDHLLSPCSAEGDPLTKNGLYGGEMKIVPLSLPQDIY